MATRVGYRMDLVVRHVVRFPGEVKYQVARAIGPHGSNAYGDAAIYRAACAGLIELQPNPKRRFSYVLHPTAAGRAYVAGEPWRHLVAEEKGEKR